MPFACPHCGNHVEDSPHLAGQIVACPHCGGHIQLPHSLILASPDVAPQVLPVQLHPAMPSQPQQPPTFFISTAPKPQPRLESVGWFTRAFSTTSGILVALLVFIVGPPILICGGCMVVGIGGATMVPVPYRPVSSSSIPANTVRGPIGDESTAKKYAVAQLSKKGLSISEGELRATNRDGKWTVAGRGVNSAGKYVDALVVFSVSRTGDTIRWTVDEVVAGD